MLPLCLALYTLFQGPFFGDVLIVQWLQLTLSCSARVVAACFRHKLVREIILENLIFMEFQLLHVHVVSFNVKKK